MFKKYFDNFTDTFSMNMDIEKKVQIFPVTEDNLDALFILIDNCVKSGTLKNENVKIATIHPKFWLGDIMDSYHQHIRYVCNSPSFRIFKMENDDLKSFTYNCLNIEVSENDLDNFFLENKFKKMVIYYITKYVDLVTLRVFYNIRYADMTEKYEERDLKIKEILK